MSELVSTRRDALRRHTPARVGLARAGTALATAEQLEFQLDHALARDAVHARLDVAATLAGLQGMGLQAVALDSQAADRTTYLRRPDLGRRLSAESAARLAPEGTDLVFVIADGLSALAVERHALALVSVVLGLLQAEEWRLGPVCVVGQGRVAVGDEIGERLGARMVVMLIGERPGLSSADSLGVYLTWEPRVGRTDAERNCISNVRAEGLGYAEAAERIVAQMREARRVGTTGVGSGGSEAVPLIA